MSLVEALERAGRPAVVLALRDGQRRLPRGWKRQVELAGARLIVIDGYEQLGWMSRWALKTACRWRDWGMFVTAHRDVGFPSLARTAVSLELAQSIVEQLLPPGQTAIDGHSVADAFAAARGNLREMLFALYDRFESQPRG